MTRFTINTEQIYEDRSISEVKIEKEGRKVVFDGIYEDDLLKTANDGSISTSNHVECSYEGEMYLPEGTTFNVEVVTPRPIISVEINTKNVGEGDVDYAYWRFKSTNQFEQWIDMNGLELYID